MELSQLMNECLAKQNALKDLIDIKPALEDEDDTLIAEYSKLAKGSVRLSTMVQELTAEKVTSQQLSTALQDLANELKLMNTKINELSEEVPVYLPGKQTSTTTHSDEPKTPVRKESVVKKKENAVGGNDSKPKTKKLVTPQLAYITAKEFNSVPPYMKGRIVYSEANKSIDIVNQAVVDKYSIVNKVRGLSDYHRRKKIQYRDQDTKETEDVHYITDADITEFTSAKLDKKFLSTMTILRHCGRLKQFRTGKITKHVLLPAAHTEH